MWVYKCSAVLATSSFPFPAHSPKLSNGLRLRNLRNSFIVHAPQSLRAAWIPISSITRMTAGTPRARNAPATCSVESESILTRSSSE